MNVRDMLGGYRATASPQLKALVAEFHELSASEQRELLFRMIIDTATNPTRKVPNEQPGPAA